MPGGQRTAARGAVGPRRVGGPARLGLHRRHGVAAEDITEHITRHPSSALTEKRAHAYRATTRVAVRLHLANPAGAAAWAAEGASLVLAGRQGVELKVLAVWQEAPIAGGGVGKVVVEAEAPAPEIRGPFSLRLWEAGGTRPVTLGGVTFP